MNSWERNERCAKQGHPSHRVVIYVMTNGAEHFCAWCFACDKNVTRDVERTHSLSYYPKARILEALARKKMTVSQLLRVQPDAALRSCYVCNEEDHCEDDHVAERTIHGDFADRLPVVPLCEKCHHLKTHNLQEFMRRLRGGFVPCP